jgi:hypothetical protein
MGRSGIGISPPAQFGAELLERYVGKSPGFIPGDLSLLLERLAVSSARKFLYDPRHCAAVKVQSNIEIAAITDPGKPLVRPDPLRQFAAEKLTEGAICWPREEIACDDAESSRRAELG